MLARLLVLALALVPVAAPAQVKWQEGAHYTLLSGSQVPDPAAGRIQVTEVFSYGCVHCFRAKDAMAKLAASLPADAVMNYVHASFLPAEAWPMFQRAYYTALELGIATPNHDAMFRATWETAEIPLLDAATGRIRKPLPTIQDAAKFYARVASIDPVAFVQASTSPAVETRIARAEELVKLWRIPGTPAVVVNGRYLIDNSTLSSWDELIALVNYLVGLERTRLARR